MAILRSLNMFILTGICLIIASFVGFATQNKFLTEPGQITNPKSSLIYFGAGVLMLINGWVSIRMAQAAPQDKAKSPEPSAENSGEHLIDTL